MAQSKDIYFARGYKQGYWDGYRAGAEDQRSGQTVENVESNIMKLPIRVMEISVRAQNCLMRAGCTCVGDVALLSERRVAVMRNLGPKSAGEIAGWLEKQGLPYNAWSKYL